MNEQRYVPVQNNKFRDLLGTLTQIKFTLINAHTNEILNTTPTLIKT